MELLNKIVWNVNRLGWAALAGIGTGAHGYEIIVGGNLRETLPLFNHVGDVGWGSLAVTGGRLAATMLRGTGVIRPRNEKAMSLALAGVGIGLLFLNETLGVGGGTPDLLDLPGAVVGYLGTAAILDLKS